MTQYYTVILDFEKLERWIKARKQNGAKINYSIIANAIGYSKSYLSRLENEKNNIEVGGRFIGTLIYTFRLDFFEIFTIVPARKDANHPQNRYEKFNQRYAEKNYSPQRLYGKREPKAFC